MIYLIPFKTRSKIVKTCKVLYKKSEGIVKINNFKYEDKFKQKKECFNWMSEQASDIHLLRDNQNECSFVYFV